MAHYLHLIISCISLLFLLLVPSNSQNATTTFRKTQPFGFLKHLKGCKKGETLAGLRELKQYLNKFGYLNYHSSKAHDNDDFDDLLEEAMKTYQANYNLKITGTLDSETLSKMAMPRCGVPDIVNGTNTMRINKKGHHLHHHHNPKKLHTVFHYTFFQGFPRWPVGETSLTYWFDPATPLDAKPAFVRAFDKWASVTQYFTFVETQYYDSSDITIGFASGNHGDGSSFDGRGGTLAHAFAPTDGRLHCDADELWSIGAVPDYIDLESVALHEIGHLLGLGHSSIKDAIMYPTISPGVARDIQDDDIQGIKVWDKIMESDFGVHAAAKSLLDDRKRCQEMDVSNTVSRRGQQRSWTRPPTNWLKINIDAATFIDLQSIGVSYVIRNDHGDFICARARRIDADMQPREAEALRLKEALSWTINQGYKSCIFETDAMMLVDACKGKPGRSYFHTIVSDCVNLFKHFDNVLVEYVHRSANVVAHTLAIITHSMSEFQEWFSDALDIISDVLMINSI